MTAPARSIPFSAAAAAREVKRRALVARNYVPHTPFERQAEFLSLDCFEALYGGAAGGGKSDALLMAAAQYLHVPGYAALILRRTYADLALEDAIMARAESWWAGVPGIHWDPKDKRFDFPAGSSITFGYLDTEVDKFRYQGAAFQCICFDELTQFTASKYSYLTSRIRRGAGVAVPLRVRAASNPGGIGHDWVYKRFVDPKTSVAPFVPARLDDNFHLDRASYAETLARLDPTTREQLLRGVWIRDGAGLVYQHFDDRRNCCAQRDIPALQYYIVGVDFGVVDSNAITVLGWRDHDPTIYVVKSYRLKGLVSEVAAAVLELRRQFAPVAVVGDVGGMGKLFAEELLVRYGVYVQPAEKTNKPGYISLLNAALAAGRIRVLDDGAACKDLLQEWVELPWAENRLKEAEGFNNHAADSALYSWRAAIAYAESPKTPQPERGSPEELAAIERRLEEAATSDDIEEKLGWG